MKPHPNSPPAIENSESLNIVIVALSEALVSTLLVSDPIRMAESLRKILNRQKLFIKLYKLKVDESEESSPSLLKPHHQKKIIEYTVSAITRGVAKPAGHLLWV